MQCHCSASDDHVRVPPPPQLLVLRSFNIDATTTPAFIKYRMFAALSLYVTTYFLCMIALLIVDTAAAPHGLTPWAATFCRQALELANPNPNPPA